jgi:uncharacterized protein
MQLAFPYRIKEKQLWLSPGRCIFWEEQKSLIVSDLHFGKTGHFRKAGIAVPQAVYKEDLQRLFEQIQYFQPQTLIIVGDLFHSLLNMELELFRKWRNDLPDLTIHLIKGNHDILEDAWYIRANINLNNEKLLVDDICFIHDINHVKISKPVPIPVQGSNPGYAEPSYFFSGHLHPGIRVNGWGKQSLCFPCFHFGKHYAVIPAFSRFTGVAIIQPGTGENVFAIVENKVMQLQ